MTLTNIWIRIFNKTRGRFFGVDYYKKDGSFRSLNGKVGRIDSVDGERFLTVWDAKNNGWRKVNLETIRAFRCGELSI